MTLLLPIPHPVLRPNGSHGHWSKTARQRKRHRRLAFLAVKQALNGQPAPTFTHYTLAFYFETARDRDDDNFSASCKSYRDGIADALKIDDHTIKLSAAPFMLIDRARPRLEFTLHP